MICTHVTTDIHPHTTMSSYTSSDAFGQLSRPTRLATVTYSSYHRRKHSLRKAAESLQQTAHLPAASGQGTSSGYTPQILCHALKSPQAHLGQFLQPKQVRRNAKPLGVSLLKYGDVKIADAHLAVPTVPEPLSCHLSGTILPITYGVHGSRRNNVCRMTILGVDHLLIHSSTHRNARAS